MNKGIELKSIFHSSGSALRRGETKTANVARWIDQGYLKCFKEDLSNFECVKAVTALRKARIKEYCTWHLFGYEGLSGGYDHNVLGLYGAAILTEHYIRFVTEYRQHGRRFDILSLNGQYAIECGDVRCDDILYHFCFPIDTPAVKDVYLVDFMVIPFQDVDEGLHIYSFKRGDSYTTPKDMQQRWLQGYLER